MKSLRTNNRLDTLKEQKPWRNGRWSRSIYVLILLGIGALVVNYFVGDAVVLRADGMVLRNRYAVAVTYPARVEAIYVKEGDRVEEGQVLAKLESADILKDIAQLSVQYADITARDAQMRIRSATNKSLLPLAERHATQTADAVRQYDKMKGLIPTNKQDEALGSKYNTAARLAELKSESKVLEQQLPLMQKAQSRAENALLQLASLYNDGNVRAPASGVVGAKIPVVGQVSGKGDTLLDVYGERSWVLAYLPEIYLFSVHEGQRVEVTAGRRRAMGTIEAVLPIADALPPEFQNMFRPRDRGRLVRIALPSETKFAISEKIRVSGCALGWCWTSKDAAARSVAAWVLGAILS